jgi:hypothetical protein
MTRRGFGIVGRAGGRARRGRGGSRAGAARGGLIDDNSDDEPVFVAGRHSDVADTGAQSEVSSLCRCYRQLPGHSLMALSVGFAQQHLSELSHITLHSRGEMEELAATRANLSDAESIDHRVRVVHLARLTSTINHLLALEHTMALHVAASLDMQEQGDSAGFFCDGCGCAAHANALDSSTARRR